LPELTPAVRAALRQHSWPGNVRELRNVIERALVLSPPGVLELVDPPRRVVEAPAGDGTLPFPATLRQITTAAVEATLKLVHGNKSETARRLGISRPRLQRILEGKIDDDV
jgi:transcriptional regulator of acetoin/glycerol metabolism